MICQCQNVQVHGWYMLHLDKMQNKIIPTVIACDPSRGHRVTLPIRLLCVSFNTKLKLYSSVFCFGSLYKHEMTMRVLES